MIIYSYRSYEEGTTVLLTKSRVCSFKACFSLLSCFSLLIFIKTSMDNFFYSLFPVSGHMCNMLDGKDFQFTRILRMTHSHQVLPKINVWQTELQRCKKVTEISFPNSMNRFSKCDNVHLMSSTGCLSAKFYPFYIIKI